MWQRTRETRLVQAIASGDVDGGWPSTRAFANAGIHGLEAVEAPLTISSYAASKALVSGPVAGDLLAQLVGSGVKGLGLAVGPLRRPFAAQAPLLGLPDWKGVTFRSFNSPVQADAIRALGATPVNVGSDWADQVAAGALRGVEFDIAQYAANDNGSAAPFVTANVVLWPKVFVLALSQKRWDALTDQQRVWVQQAADLATKASVDATWDETTPAAGLCATGVRFVDASAAQLAALHDAVAPVIAKLAADPVNGPLLAKIQAIAGQYPQVDEPNVPATCRDLGTAPVFSGRPGGRFVAAGRHLPPSGDPGRRCGCRGHRPGHRRHVDPHRQGWHVHAQLPVHRPAPDGLRRQPLRWWHSRGRQASRDRQHGLLRR